MGTELDSDTHVWTTLGLKKKAELVYATGGSTNETSIIEWHQWSTPDGAIVRRDVSVELKRETV